MKLKSLSLCVAIAAFAGACTESQSADVESVTAPRAPSANVQVKPEREPVHVAVRAVDHEGKAVGQARVLQLSPEVTDPRELGLTPVPAGPN